MQSEKQIFENFLKAKGLKLTKPRQIILEEVFEIHKHFDADLLYDIIKAKHSGVSLTTIYRTIPLLIEAGLVKKTLRKDAKEFYEHIYGHPKHIHLICTNCGKIIEDEAEQLLDYISKVTAKHNFDLEEHSICLKGLCKNCQ